uniref:Uncharacterized protein n=1 Tax=Aegilops tauschii subsp. strangulata TaxID=200361 RepID=A0A453A0L2_AEGTS
SHAPLPRKRNPEPEQSQTPEKPVPRHVLSQVASRMSAMAATGAALRLRLLFRMLRVGELIALAALRGGVHREADAVPARGGVHGRHARGGRISRWRRLVGDGPGLVGTWSETLSVTMCKVHKEEEEEALVSLPR